jgi:DNA-binding NtrC family response regulator
MAVILIVEDDVFLRNIIELMVEDFGHRTLTAGDIDEALLLLHSPDHIDALITDIRLKKASLGGFELAHLAVKLRLKLPVLYITGNSMTDEMAASFVEGAHFLQKPYSPSQLQHSVEKLLAPHSKVA